LLDNGDFFCLEVAVDEALSIRKSDLIENSFEVTDLNYRLLVSGVVFSRVNHGTDKILKCTHITHLRLPFRFSKLVA